MACETAVQKFWEFCVEIIFHWKKQFAVRARHVSDITLHSLAFVFSITESCSAHGNSQRVEMWDLSD